MKLAGLVLDTEGDGDNFFGDVFAENYVHRFELGRREE